MTICKTCVYWGMKFDNIPSNVKRIEELSTHKYCGNSKIGCSEDIDAVNDGFGNGQFLSTGPNFGCIHHSDRLSSKDQ